jgi:hypothetical protein
MAKQLKPNAKTKVKTGVTVDELLAIRKRRYSEAVRDVAQLESDLGHAREILAEETAWLRELLEDIE